MHAPWDIEFISSVDALGSRIWDKLCGGDYPFFNYAFLAALEKTGCVGAGSGWQTHHGVLRQNGTVVGIMPLYQKTHSYGEYVFDWAWSDAYLRHGVDYYPKLVTAVPFTPATGPRLFFAEGIDTTQATQFFLEGVQSELSELRASSWHCLFPSKQVSDQLSELDMSPRLGCQYHWINKDYLTFDDFLADFSSRKRKNLKKERRRIAEQELELSVKQGRDLSRDEWRQFYFFYHLTYFKRSGRQGYLNEEFFLALADTMPDKLVMVIARHRGEMVAASLFFQGGDTLYGRYWGCSREFEFLHFEACYYQGIEYAISQGLQRFDPGAQGEHKIQRGFTPIPTWSNHWIGHPQFRTAIDDFLIREKVAMTEYIKEAGTLLPFKAGS